MLALFLKKISKQPLFVVTNSIDSVSGLAKKQNIFIIGGSEIYSEIDTNGIRDICKSEGIRF